MDLRRGRRTGVTLSLQEPLETDGQLTLADTLPDEADMAAGCDSRASSPSLVSVLPFSPSPPLLHSPPPTPSRAPTRNTICGKSVA